MCSTPAAASDVPTDWEQLAQTIRDTIAGHKRTQASDPFPEPTHRLIRHLVDVIAETEPREIAEHAANGVINTREPMWRVMELTREIVADKRARAERKRRPTGHTGP